MPSSSPATPPPHHNTQHHTCDTQDMARRQTSSAQLLPVAAPAAHPEPAHPQAEPVPRQGCLKGLIWTPPPQTMLPSSQHTADRILQTPKGIQPASYLEPAHPQAEAVQRLAVVQHHLLQRMAGLQGSSQRLTQHAAAAQVQDAQQLEVAHAGQGDARAGAEVEGGQLRAADRKLCGGRPGAKKEMLLVIVGDCCCESNCLAFARRLRLGVAQRASRSESWKLPSD